MMTPKEEHDEFWMLTYGILQDSRVDANEARIVKRWLEEHRHEDLFDRTIAHLDKFLTDRVIDRFESSRIIDAIGGVLSTLRRLSNENQGAA